ncbi:hypothetical protein Tco_1579322, partial [Tanacetum coccineum]
MVLGEVNLILGLSSTIVRLQLLLSKVCSDDYDTIHSTSDDYDTSSDKNISSSKCPYKELLKWYDDSTDKDIPEFKFSKSTTKGKASNSIACKLKASNSIALPTPRNPPQPFTVKSPVAIRNCLIGLENVETWDMILKKTFEVRKPIVGSVADHVSKGRRKLGSD